MAESGVNYQRIIFDLCDPELTKVWIFCQATGDSPIGVHGWHHKVFPARYSTLDIMHKWVEGHEEPIMWPQAAPEEMPAEATLADLRIPARSRNRVRDPG